MLAVVFLVIGFVLLVKGADWFVEGAASIAKRLRIPSIVIGLTIVALGTSLPELAVSMTAAIKGSNAIAVGNVVGSNIMNLLVVVGISALIKPMVVQKSMMKVDYPFSILFAGVLLLLSADMIFGKTNLMLSRINGMVLLLMLVWYMGMTIKSALDNRLEGENLDEVRSMGQSIAFCLIGVVCIITGGQLVVKGATEIARMFGLSETLIGLTIVAVGTSLPELVTSVVAAKKGESDISLGNVVGSNIMNIGFILGMSSLISPIAIEVVNLYDMLILIVISAIFFIPLRKNYKVGRMTGASMLVTYVVYTLYIIMR